MATTIDDATMIVTVNEDIKLNGHQVGSKIIQKIDGINEASRRILTVSTDETELLSLSSSAGRGTYSTTALQYIRISNLDDTNFIRITFSSGSLNRYDMKLPAERTAIFTSPSISGSHVDNDTFGSFVDFQSMKATADTSTVDIELFVAST
jgi:hypothetical protein|tara:strand:+ start:5530 stop:5982 length:453 start_codon:yes stop_codon:yes gene_type:complete